VILDFDFKIVTKPVPCPKPNPWRKSSLCGV